LISPDNLVGPDQVLVLTNAMYFKDAWKVPFDKSKTHKDKFYKSDGSIDNVEFMQGSGMYAGFQNEYFTALELPYSNSEFSMRFIVPRGSLADFEEQYLDFQNYMDWSFSSADFKSIKIPRFKIETETDAIPILRKFGMKAAFNDADFTSMVYGNGVSINVISHKALIEVDEEGTVAAAATGVGAVARSMPQRMELNANKPFIFMLVHNESRTILFIGKVENPH
jgi:serine protease inhibitor